MALAARLIARGPVAARVGPAAVAASTRNFSSNLPKRGLDEKTGQTGAALLGGGLAAYLLSKEILVFHAETVVVFSVGAITAALIKKFGADVAASLDDRSKVIADVLSASRQDKIDALQAQIAEQKAIPDMLASTNEIFDINRELNAMSLELEYRMAKHNARNAVAKELNTFMKVEAEERAKLQGELVDQIERDVLASLKGQEAAILKTCLGDLERLAAAK